MLSSLLFCIFFAAVLIIALQTLSDDTNILTQHVDLNGPLKSMGPEPAMGHVRRAVWGMYVCI